MKNALCTVSLIVSAISILTGCGEKIKPGDHKVERPLINGVAVETVTAAATPAYYETTGTVRARNTSLVSARIMGVVKEIKASAADRVSRGDVLLLIHSPDIDARVRAAGEAKGEADKGLKMAGQKAELMERSYARFERLYSEQAVTEQEFDEVRTNREVAFLQREMARKALQRAEASLSEAEAFQEYAVITSPVDGIIAEKKIDIGSMTAPGTALFIIEGPLYRVEAAVDEGRLSSIIMNSPVKVLIETLHVNTTGRVGEIIRRIDGSTRTFTVKIDLDENSKSLRGGLYAQVKFPVGSATKLFVNKGAIVTRGELRGVYVVSEEGIAALRLVRTGKQKDEMVEIVSGLEGGERIITKGTDKAVDGGKVVYAR